MKIATWNVERLASKPRRAAVGACLAAIDADVWVLTETDDTLTPGPGYRAVDTSPREGPARPDERWVIIWSRLPMEPLRATSDPSRSVAALVRPAAGRPALLVYGTVLPWIGSEPAAQGWAFGKALEAQSRDWDDLREQHPGAELCVLGDLNQDLSDHHYYGSRRNRDALRAALTAARLTALTGGPDDPVRVMAPGHASIDHICVETDSTLFAEPQLEAWPVGQASDPRISDHFGVAVRSA